MIYFDFLNQILLVNYFLKRLINILSKMEHILIGLAIILIIGCLLIFWGKKKDDENVREESHKETQIIK